MMTLKPLLCATVISATFISATLSTAAFANPGSVERVTEGIITAGMAVELAENCDDVGIRMLRGLNFLQGLKNHLTDLGYSNSEIDAYIDDDVEKDRLESIARQRLSALGVVAGNAASHCTVAQGQIAAGTQLGRLMR